MRLRGILLLMICAATGSAQEVNPFAADPAAADLGKGTFRIYCAPCHGFRAQGGRGGPDLSRGTYRAGERDGDLFRVISNGVAGTEMQAYGGIMPSETVWRLVSFVRSSSRPADNTPPAGDPAHGEALFWGKGGCGACHAVANHGARFGPELTRIGRRQSAAQIRQVIVDPNSNPTPGYDSVTVQTLDGRSISGLERGWDDFSIQILDRSGQNYSFYRSELKTVTREKLSLMPSGYGKAFTPSELDDLVAYLVHQGASDR